MRYWLPTPIPVFLCQPPTRSPRPGEKDGEDYFFITQEEFDCRKAAGEFLETATVFDHSYGTLSAQVDARLKAGKNVVLDIDTKGAEQIRASARTDLGFHLYFAAVRRRIAQTDHRPPDRARRRFATAYRPGRG